MLAMIAVLLSFNVILPLVPVIIIAILIVAAAGLTRGADIFALLGIGALIGLGGGRGGGIGRAGAGKGIAGFKYPGNVVSRGNAIGKHRKIPKMAALKGLRGKGAGGKGAGGKLPGKVAAKGAAGGKTPIKLSRLSRVTGNASRAASLRSGGVMQKSVTRLGSALSSKNIRMSTGSAALFAGVKRSGGVRSRATFLQHQRMDNPKRVSISTEKGSRGAFVSKTGKYSLKIPLFSAAFYGGAKAWGFFGKEEKTRRQAARMDNATFKSVKKEIKGLYKHHNQITDKMIEDYKLPKSWRGFKKDLRSERKAVNATLRPSTEAPGEKIHKGFSKTYNPEPPNPKNYVGRPQTYAAALGKYEKDTNQAAGMRERYEHSYNYMNRQQQRQKNLADNLGRKPTYREELKSRWESRKDYANKTEGLKDFAHVYKEYLVGAGLHKNNPPKETKKEAPPSGPKAADASEKAEEQRKGQEKKGKKKPSGA